MRSFLLCKQKQQHRQTGVNFTCSLKHQPCMERTMSDPDSPPQPDSPWQHSTSTDGDSSFYWNTLKYKTKCYMKQCRLTAASDLKLKKIKKGNKQEGAMEGGSVCRGVVTTHPWCVELQWCVFVRASVPPGVVGGRRCYRVPCCSEVIHVLAKRSWWGCEEGERGEGEQQQHIGGGGMGVGGA